MRSRSGPSRRRNTGPVQEVDAARRRCAVRASSSGWACAPRASSCCPGVRLLLLLEREPLLSNILARCRRAGRPTGGRGLHHHQPRRARPRFAISPAALLALRAASAANQRPASRRPRAPPRAARRAPRPPALSAGRAPANARAGSLRGPPRARFERSAPPLAQDLRAPFAPRRPARRAAPASGDGGGRSGCAPPGRRCASATSFSPSTFAT